jgi:hypothetical protein
MAKTLATLEAAKKSAKLTALDKKSKKEPEAEKQEQVNVIDIGLGISVITLPQETLLESNVLIVSDAILVMRRFGEKARGIMRDKQLGVAQQARTAKVPELEAKDSLHEFADGGYGLPAGSFKAALVESSRYVGGGKQMNMTFLKGALRVFADGNSSDGTPLVRIMTEGYRIREDFVRNDSGVADIRYRPQFDSWSCLLRIAHAPQISRAQVVQLVRAAGRFNGMGEWRPMSKESKSGSWGTWRLATPEEIKEFSEVSSRVNKKAS